MSQIEINAIRHLKGHKGGIYSLSCDHEDDSILSAGSDGFICKWTPLQNDEGRMIAQTGERIFCMQMFSSEKILFAGTMKGDLFQISFKDEPNVRRLQFHDKAIYRLGICNENLISIAADGILCLWNPENAGIINNLKICPSKLRSLAMDQLNRRLYTGDADGNLWIVDLDGLNSIDCISSIHEKTVFSLLYLSDEGYLLTGGMDAHLKVLLNKTVLEDIKAHWFSINDICELKGTPFVATASRDKSIRLWDRHDWSLVKELSYPKFAAHLHSVNCLLWSQKQHILYSAGDDGVIIAWKLESNYDTK